MQKTLSTIKSFIIVLTLTIGMSYVFAAWTGPTATAPGNNAEAPINVGTTAQGKGAGLFLAGDGWSATDFCIVDPVTKAETKCLSSLTGGTGGGVSKIIAGSGISVTPTAGTGDVTINSSGGFTNMQVFDASGTWTAPAGVTKVKVRAWGAGGKGVCTVNGGSGGGGGGYGEGIYTVIENTNYTVQVGQGVGDPYSTNNGKSSFGSLITSNPGGSANQTNIPLGGIGGTSNGQFNITGESGLTGNYNGGSSPMGGTFQVVPGGGGFGGGRCASNVTYGAHGRVVVEY